MADEPDLTHLILENIQHDLADLRDRLTEVDARITAGFAGQEARWQASDARFRAYDTEFAAWREEMASWRERLNREQVLRERNARKTLELFDVLIRKVQAMQPPAPA
jgi:hypothetical protein